MKRSAYWDAMSTPEWHQNIAVELDSALNKWIDSIPDHCDDLIFIKYMY